ncbi:hypothetical protein [Psychroflexus tropicus]|nr:hypothetical protein [Psychroflexus tropicus]
MKALKSVDQHRRIEPDKGYSARFMKQELSFGYKLSTHKPVGNQNY